MTSPDPQQLDTGIDTVPVLFLPVRTETRFVDTAESSELWLRVYPDQIHINGHRPELTAAELAAGVNYWQDLWAAGNPPPTVDAVQAPWRGLVSRFGAPRAAWIVRQCTPLNVVERPSISTPVGGTPNPSLQPASPAVSPPDSLPPATASLLPPAWTVVLLSNGVSSSYTGSPIANDLALSLAAADSSLASGFPDGMPVDAGMRWLVDFDAAVSAGMALRIPLTVAQRQAGFERVLVYGTSFTADATDFAALLDEHHYTDGLAFVPQGAPTNNTTDASSAYSRSDPDAAISFAVEVGPPLTGQAGSDGAQAAQLLGVPLSTFDHVRYADRFDQRNGVDMLTALWPATLGYFLRQMGDGQLGEDQIEQARTWSNAHVRPRGPLPALRTGQSPYGILPVTSTARWVATPGDRVESVLAELVQRLLPTWVSSSAAAPHLGATPGDPDADLAHVLGQDASSMSFRGRHVLGDELLWNLIGFEAVPTSAGNEWWQLHLVPGRQLLDSFGYRGWNPRLIHTGLAPTDYPVEAPTVLAGALSETDPLPADATVGAEQLNYIQWLRRASIGDIQANHYPGPAVPDTLLYRILRQSMLLDYVTLAQFAQIDAGLLSIDQTRELELVDIAEPAAAVSATSQARVSTSTASITPWQVLARPVSATDTRSWAEYLLALRPEPNSRFARLAELRTSMDRLATLPTAELDRLLTESLDACSHRLDVWVTSLATRRLHQQRQTAATGPDQAQKPGGRTAYWLLRLGGKPARRSPASPAARRPRHSGG